MIPAKLGTWACSLFSGIRKSPHFTGVGCRLVNEVPVGPKDT